MAMTYWIASTDCYGRPVPTVHYAAGGERPATPIEIEMSAEIERLREALIRARDQIVSQQAMPDPPTYIDEALASASQ